MLKLSEKSISEGLKEKFKDIPSLVRWAKKKKPNFSQRAFHRF